MAETDAILVSASVASVGKGIRYEGSHAFAYSGALQAAASDQTLFEFSTGSGLFVGTITCAGAIENNGGGVAAGTYSAFTLTFNGLDVARFKTSTSGTSPDHQAHQTYPIIIPPLTQVKLVVFSGGTDGLTTAIITGRVYGAA